MSKVVKLKIHLSLAILLLFAVLISGFFIFSPVSFRQIAFAVTGTYTKTTGVDDLTAADWNNLPDDFLDKEDTAGDSMAGPLTLPGDPSLPMHAATMQYVDNSVGSGDYVARTGDTMSGPLVLPGDPTLPNHAATMNYIDNEISNTDHVQRSGDSMTGPLVLPGSPSLPNHAANMQYVDDAVTITNTSGTRLQMVCGSMPLTAFNTTNPYNWTLRISVDTTAAGLSNVHFYISSMEGLGNHYRATGVNTIYQPTSNSYVIYLQYYDPFDPTYLISVADAISWFWGINWCALGTP